MADVGNITIKGRSLSFPVRVRAARSWAATFLVDAPAVQALIAQTGLQVAPVTRRRGIASIAFVRYEDTDLDAYNEVAIAFVVRAHDAKGASPTHNPLARARNRTGVLIHHLPVTQAFTLEAGRTIWGYPKFMAEIDIDEEARSTTCRLRHDGADVLRLTVRRGKRPSPRVPNMPTYSFLDGVLRRTMWETHSKGTRGRFGGVKLELGSHPIADELRAIGLPRRALFSTSVDRFSASFGPAEVVQPVHAPAR